MKRIRLDMPVLPSECQDEEDDAQRADNDNGDDDVRRAGDHVGDDHRSSNNPDDEVIPNFVVIFLSKHSRPFFIFMQVHT